MKKNTYFKWLFISAGGILVFLAVNWLLFDLLIPDPCYYHTHETTGWIELFFTPTSSSNGHPEMNGLNVLLTLVIGGILGNGIYSSLLKYNRLR